MARRQRVAQYIQRLAYQSLVEHEERDERPKDAPQRAPEPTSTYPNWNATSFASYTPFRGPASG